MPVDFEPLRVSLVGRSETCENHRTCWERLVVQKDPILTIKVELDSMYSCHAELDDPAFNGRHRDSHKLRPPRSIPTGHRRNSSQHGDSKNLKKTRLLS